MGKMNRTKHSKILSVLEKRALKYKNAKTSGVNDDLDNTKFENIDETGTVDTSGLTDDSSVESDGSESPTRPAREVELEQVSGVDEYLLRVHGVAPGSKPEGVWRMIYENLNGIRSRLSDNDKLDKIKSIIDDMEADIACFNEHRLNLQHKENKNGFSQMFKGGEAEIRSIAAHNSHEGKEVGKVQEGGTAMLLYGETIEQYDFEASGKDDTGLGRWVSMVFRGENGLVTRVATCYNPCYNSNAGSRTSYQQHRRYFVVKEKDDTCPRKRFLMDLKKQLEKWMEDGERIIVCMDANEDIYRKQIGRTLTDPAGLGLKEVVGEFTGEKLGATYFRGSKPIDAVWASPDITVVGACVMPVGYGAGDHRLFQIDFRLESIIGAAPPRIIRPAARRLNTKLPGVAKKYNKELEKLYIRHRVNSRLVAADDPDAPREVVKDRVDKIDEETKQFRKRAEKKCRKLKSGRIPFSPEAAIWIRRKQVYESLLRYKLGKIRNRSNLRRTAQRCGIQSPLKLSWEEIKERLKVCEEKCEFFLKHGQSYRKKHLQHRLAVARAKSNREAERRILEIIQRERERAMWRRLRCAMTTKKGRSVRVVQRVREDGTIQEATTQSGVENMIWDEIHGKRFFLAEQAPICQGWLRGEFGYMANTEAARQVLDGSYQYREDMHGGTKELLQEARRIRERVPKDSVETVVTTEAWQEKWRSAKEKTASSESGLHFGHYIAGAESKIVSKHDAMKATICLKRGFSLERWARGLSCMLEKLPGCSLLDKLRSILLMEADYNAVNKIECGIRMLDNVRKYGLMAEEIFSEIGRTAEDGALSKILFYDIVRQCRLTAAISSVDATNCYDSIAHAIASIIYQACGVPVEGVEAMLSAIQDMKYFLRTAFGDSCNFRGSKIEIKYQGLCQGNGAAPAGWAVISITILNAHKRKGHGATFVCPISEVNVMLAAILFVDDCDLIHIDMNCDDDAGTTFEKTQQAVLNWGNLLIGSGGSYKPNKCFYHLISFKWDRKGKWSYEENHKNSEFDMVVPMPDGSVQKIDHLPVSMAKKTLGVFSAPNGEAQGAITAMKGRAQEWVDRAKEGNLRRRDVWFLLDCQFWPSVGFGLSCNISEMDALQESLLKEYYNLIPMGGVIRTAPAAARQLGKGFYGIGCPDVGVECLVGQVGKLLMHYGCPSSIGMKMKVSFNQLVIELGISEQPLQESYTRYKKWVTWSWLVSLWEKCDMYDIRVETNDIPLKLPRERDKWLMREFIRLGYRKEELERLNRARIYQQVLFLSDIIAANGRGLDERYLRKRRSDEQWSSLRFPKEKPPPADFRLWQQAIRQVVPAAGLPVHLGRFLHEGYKVWEWRLSLEEQCLLRYNSKSMSVYEPTSETRRTWKMVQREVDIEVIGEPCSVREGNHNKVSITSVAAAPRPEKMPESLFDVLREWDNTWMWKSLRLMGDDNWLHDSIKAGTCIAVTDGSYIREIYPELCSCAFVLECTEGRGRIFGSFPEQSKVANAYRGELLGLMAIHLILLAANKLASELRGRVRIFSDCLGALNKVTSLPANRLPSGCKHSDILKNIMVNCSGLSFDCEYLHVVAHQDDKVAYHKLLRPSQLNCCMDTNAKNVIWGLVGEELPPMDVFPLEPVAVFVGREKMTSGSEDELRFWCQRKEARKILACDKVKVLDQEQFDEVEWRGVHCALNDVPRMFQIWACKQVLGIAGTNEMQARYIPNHDKRCPSCGVCVETCGHVLTCAEIGRVDLLNQSIELVDTWMQDHGTDPTLRVYLTKYAKSRGGEAMTLIVREREGPYRKLAESMDKIGWRRFMEGMVSKEILTIQGRAQETGKKKLPIQSWCAGLVTRLLEVTHGQWLYRNVHVHDILTGDIATRRKEDIRRELLDQIEIGGEGLVEEDKYLLEINLDELDTSSGEEQTYWLLALRAARVAFQIRELRRQEGVADEEA